MRTVKGAPKFGLGAFNILDAFHNAATGPGGAKRAQLATADAQALKTGGESFRRVLPELTEITLDLAQLREANRPGAYDGPTAQSNGRRAIATDGVWSVDPARGIVSLKLDADGSGEGPSVEIPLSVLIDFGTRLEARDKEMGGALPSPAERDARDRNDLAFLRLAIERVRELRPNELIDASGREKDLGIR